MTRLIVFSLLLLLAACGGEEPKGGAKQAPPSEIAEAKPTSPQAALPLRPEPVGPKLDWHTALDGDTVVVDLSDATSHYRVETVELVGPGGVHVLAPTLTRETERSFGYRTDYPTGVFSFGVSGGPVSGVDLGAGIGASHPLGLHDRNAAPKTTTRARIRVPDLAAYRADRKAWRIEARLLDSVGETSSISIPAP